MKKLNVCKAMKGIGTIECLVLFGIVAVIVMLGVSIYTSHNNNADCEAVGGVMIKSYDGTVCIPTSHTIDITRTKYQQQLHGSDQ